MGGMAPSALGIGQLLLTPLAHQPHQEIVYGNHYRYTYRIFKDRIGRLAQALTTLGVKPGQPVAMMDWDSHRYLESYFAVPMMGAVLVSVNVRLAPQQIIHILNHSRSTVVMVNAEFWPLIEKIQGELTERPQFLLMADEGAAPTAAAPIAGEYESLLARAHSKYDFPALDENSVATSFYTTGTTGEPKGVTFTHRQLVLHTLAGAVELGTRAVQGRMHRDDVYMPITPMFHAHAWGYPFIATLLGLKQVYPGRYSPQQLLALKQREGVTFSHCVPTLLQMLLDAPESAAMNLADWKMAVGGAALSPALAQRALERGMDVFAGYGLSESCPLLALSSVDTADLGSERELALRITTGRAIPLVELRVTEEKGTEAPRDGKTLGEVQARAPWLTAAYVEDEALSAELWAGGWLHTGDLAWRNAAGYIQICDRLKDVVKTGGEWVPSTLVENILAQHPSVNEVAVVAKQDRQWGERPVVWVSLKAGAAASPEQLMEWVRGAVARGEIPPYAVPDWIEIVGHLPHTSVGKINKKEIREQLNWQSEQEKNHG
jgi:fatty-acyl-CoA synthase